MIGRRLTVLAAMEVALLSTRREHAPQGLAGGGAAWMGSQRLIEASGAVKELPGCFSITVRPGAVATPIWGKAVDASVAPYADTAFAPETRSASSMHVGM